MVTHSKNCKCVIRYSLFTVKLTTIFEYNTWFLKNLQEMFERGKTLDFQFDMVADILTSVCNLIQFGSLVKLSR